MAKISRGTVIGMLALSLGACASTGEPEIPEGAERSVRVEANGDVIEEYRVGGQLRMVKVTPSRGPAYYLMDENGDGRLDKSKGASEKDISPVYWKLYGW